LAISCKPLPQLVFAGKTGQTVSCKPLPQQAFAGKAGLTISCKPLPQLAFAGKLSWRPPANPSHSWFLQEKSHMILLYYLSLHRNVAI